MGFQTLDRLAYTTPLGERHLYLRTNSTDSQVIGQVFKDCAFDLKELPRIDELANWLNACRLSGKRPLIIDAGANIGISSIALSLQIPDGLIIAMEPEQHNFELLASNTEGLPVLPLPVALNSNNGVVALTDPGQGEWGYRTKNTDERCALAVPSTTVGTIYSIFSENFKPFIVKIDIEGGEQNVFSGDTSWLDTTPLLIIELHDWMLPKERSSHPVLKSLLQTDRDFVIKGENVFSMPNNFTPHDK